MTIPSYDAWVLARIVADQPIDGQVAGMSGAFRPLADRLAALPPLGRPILVEGYSMGLADPSALIDALGAARPTGPPPAAEEDRPEACATLASVRQLVADASWPWPGWLAGGSLNSLASDPGVGKTLLAVSLARTLWSRGAWPDGQACPFPAKTRTLWVPGDHHYAQLLDLAARYELPDEAILFNSGEATPTAGLDLDDPAELAALRRRIDAYAPGLVIVDTVGMTTSRNLGKPEEARAYFGPLMSIAGETGTAFLLLTHLSRDAQALGRRIVGASRVVWKLTHPDVEGQPDRRKLWVDKSYAMKPPAMGMSIADSGCTFDFSPPAEPESGRLGRPPARLEECKRWLIDRLAIPAPVKEVRADAELAGFSSDILYRANESLKLEEFVFERRKWWKRPEADDGHPA